MITNTSLFQVTDMMGLKFLLNLTIDLVTKPPTYKVEITYFKSVNSKQSIETNYI